MVEKSKLGGEISETPGSSVLVNLVKDLVGQSDVLNQMTNPKDREAWFLSMFESHGIRGLETLKNEMATLPNGEQQNDAADVPQSQVAAKIDQA